MRPVDDKNGKIPTFYNGTFDNTTGGPLLLLKEFTYGDSTGNNIIYNFFRNGLNFNGAMPLRGGFNNTIGRVPGAQQQIGGEYRRPGIPHPKFIDPPRGQTSHIIYQETYRSLQRVIATPNRNNTGQVTINAHIQAVNRHAIEGETNQRKRYRILRVLLPREEAAELARIWKEDQWNGTDILASIQVDGVALGTVNATMLGKLAWRKISFTKSIQDNDPAGTYYGYSGAKRDLMKQLGGYCSYCEIKLEVGRNIDIEHRLPKSQYPTEILRWDNFVLACKLCNSDFKNAKPSRKFGIEKAMAVHHPLSVYIKDDYKAPVTGGVNRLPYHQIRAAAEDYTLWPDVNDGGAAAPNPTSLSLRLCNYQLYELNSTGNPIRVIPIVDATNLANKKGKITDKQILQADVWDTNKDTLRPMLVQVRVALRPSNTGNKLFDDRKDAATQNMINMAGLNMSKEQFRDRRVLARTEAWFKAIDKLLLFKKQIQQRLMLVNLNAKEEIIKEAKQLEEDQWNQILDAVEEIGFYSVWITVFKAHGLWRAGTLVQELQERAEDDPQRTSLYHGTNIKNSVVPYIEKL